MGKTCVVLMVYFAVALGAQAQTKDVPRVEVFTGYSFVSAGFPLATDPAAGSARGTLNGWNVSAAANANRWLGVVGDFGGYYGSPTAIEAFKPANCVLCTANVIATLHNIHTFAGGPQISVRSDHLTFFAHSLFGGAHTSADLVAINVPSAKISSTSFTFIAGGGVDLPFSHRFAVRFQPDYFRTTILDRAQNNFRFSAGIVFRSGQ